MSCAVVVRVLLVVHIRDCCSSYTLYSIFRLTFPHHFCMFGDKDYCRVISGSRREPWLRTLLVWSSSTLRCACSEKVVRDWSSREKSGLGSDFEQSWMFLFDKKPTAAPVKFQYTSTHNIHIANRSCKIRDSFNFEFRNWGSAGLDHSCARHVTAYQRFSCFLLLSMWVCRWTSCIHDSRFVCYSCWNFNAPFFDVLSATLFSRINFDSNLSSVNHESWMGMGNVSP